MTLQWERIQDCWSELAALAEDQFNRMRPWGLSSMCPDRESFFAAADRIRVYTVRGNITDRLVGYAVFLLGNHAHNKESLQAGCDVVYLHPDFRDGPTGIQFLEYAENELRGEGVEYVLYECPEQSTALRTILQRRGWSQVAVVMGKEL